MAGPGAEERYAVVTGSNKGIGLEICRQLASKGIFVVLTARDEKRGLEAVEKLKESGLHSIAFHQLDVTDAATISSLADFINAKFGKLDILVNHAGIGGVKADAEALRASGSGEEGSTPDWNKILTQTYELAEECLKTNYYGAKKMCEALLPLLQQSASPRIVNVSSSMGKLKNVSNEWAKAILSNGENLSEENVERVLDKFLEDFKDGSFAARGWPSFMPAYIVSKAALNAYTRILATKYPNIIINSVCPGFVKTDINHHRGILTVEEGAASPARLALVPTGAPSGRFFVRMEESEF